MEEKQFSRTALWNAYLRGYHALHDVPKIFDDFLAYHFLTDEERKSFDQQIMTNLQLFDAKRAASFSDQATALAWIMQSAAAPRITLSRARYAEDSLEKAVKQGVKQYVILGAGMDTFAFRRPEMLEKLQVFEVDHPTTQAFKRRRLAKLRWEQSAQLHFIPVDFKRENLRKVLKRSSYDPEIPSFFSFLGVTYYLSLDTVCAMFHTITDVATAGSAVIFDYLDTDAFVPERVSPSVQILLKSVQQEGESMNVGFDPSTLAAELAILGLRLHEDLSPADIQERYFQRRTDGYQACEHVHFALAVVE